MSDAQGWRRRLFVEERQVRDYLLDIDHLAGGSKACFFIGVGFTRENHGSLCEAVLEHGRIGRVMEVSVVRGETRYRVEGYLPPPHDKGRIVRTIRSDEGACVRLVTAYPVGRSDI